MIPIKSTFTLRRLAIASVAALIAGFVTWAAPAVFDTTPTDPVVVERPQAPVDAPLVPTDLGHVEDVFGPFEQIIIDTATPTPDTKNDALLILYEDGSVQFSQQYTVPFDQAWSANNVFQIRSLSLKLGYATMGTTQNSHVYVVKVLQPFVFATAPEQVHVVTAVGKVRSITTAQAEVLMRTYK